MAGSRIAAANTSVEGASLNDFELDLVPIEQAVAHW